MTVLKQVLKKFLLACLFIAVSLALHAEVLVGKVVGVNDGDTITVLDVNKTEHKVRLMGIDAPEKSQAFGNEAKKTLSNYIYKKEVTVEYKKLDKYKRIVGKVTLDGKDICLQMIRDGMAWHYTEYEKEQSIADRDLYREAEAAARAVKGGLWIEMRPVSPWIFRQK
jgi:endonuclease YncB( thermonuclease family)